MTGAAQTRAAAAKAPASSGGGSGEGLNLLPWPKVDFTKFGPVGAQGPLAHQEDQRRQPATATGCVIPHVTNHDDADITDLEAFACSSTKRTRRAASRSPCWPS